LEPKWIISAGDTILGVRHILTAPSRLESTSFVFAFGLDLFFSQISPSSTFDILGESFNKIQLVCTIAGLSAGIAVVRPMVNRKQLHAQWFF